MTQKRKFYPLSVFLVFLLLVFASGCKSDGRKASQDVNIEDFVTEDDIFDDIGGSTIDYCASDDGDGTNAVSPSGSDWANEFVDYANGDFTLLYTGNLYDAGVGPSADHR